MEIKTYLKEMIDAKYVNAETKQTKLSKFIMFALGLLSLIIYCGIFYGIWHFMGNWILNFSILGLAFCIFAYLFVFNLSIKDIRQTNDKSLITIAKVFLILPPLIYFVIMIYGLKICDKRQFDFYPRNYFIFSKYQPNITLGEMWCYFRDYKGKICENYIFYIEEKKEDLAIEWQRKRAEADEKYKMQLQKEQAQKAKENEALQRYENIILDYKRGRK